MNIWWLWQLVWFLLSDRVRSVCCCFGHKIGFKHWYCIFFYYYYSLNWCKSFIRDACILSSISLAVYAPSQLVCILCISPLSRVHRFGAHNAYRFSIAFVIIILLLIFIHNSLYVLRIWEKGKKNKQSTTTTTTATKHSLVHSIPRSTRSSLIKLLRGNGSSSIRSNSTLLLRRLLPPSSSTS